MAQYSDREGCIINERWAVILGDCSEVMTAIPWADHVITDPPYSQIVHSKSRAGARAMPIHYRSGKMSRTQIFTMRDLGFVHLSDMLRFVCSVHFGRVLRRWCLVFCDVESSHLWQESLADAGLQHCRVGAWLKTNGTPQFTGDRPGVGFEAIEISHGPMRKAWNGGGRLGIWSHNTDRTRPGYNDGDNGGRLHTTQKPVPLMLGLVSDFTSPHDLILDPFAGSGTTGVAALRLGRRCILIEKDPKYAAICVERMRAEESQSTLQAHRAGQLPLLGGIDAG